MKQTEALKEFAHFVPLERLETALQHVRAFCTEDIEHMIPCIQMGAEGPFLHSLILITASYLSEVHLMSPGWPFDFVRLQTVICYRVSLDEQVIKTNEEKEIRYETASIQFQHAGTDLLRTTISYAGFNRDEWLARIRAALPLTRVLAN
jgi:hypothetical protein